MFPSPEHHQSSRVGATPCGKQITIGEPIHVGYECGRLHARDLSGSRMDEQIYAAVQRETSGLLDLAWSIATLYKSLHTEFEIVASLLTFHIALYSIYSSKPGQ